MILVDTSVWIDHLRQTEAVLQSSLHAREILIHSLVLGELAVGNLAPRQKALQDLRELPLSFIATDDDVLQFIEVRSLLGIGLGYVDYPPLATVDTTPDSTLWTRDKRLRSTAQRLGLPMQPEVHLQ